MVNDDFYNNQINELKKIGVNFSNLENDYVISILRDKTYLFRFKGYLSNYEQDVNGKYNLDFEELEEISKIDFLLRKLILSICLDVEHIIKVKIMNLYNENLIKDCDDKINYLIENKMFTFSKDKSSNYNHKIYEEYKNDWTLFALIEVISFGSLLTLINLLEIDLPFCEDKDMLWSLKSIRNSAAHNYPMLCNLDSNKNYKINKNIFEFLEEQGFESLEISYISIPIINDLMCVLWILHKITNNKVISKRFEDIDVLKERIRNSNTEIKSSKCKNIFKTIDKYNESLFKN
ncbi:MAG: Abi family protein [Mycoplasmataceae bacterium]|nr:Abi family protein [Mycoplasmataceae bacterium]